MSSPARVYLSLSDDEVEVSQEGSTSASGLRQSLSQASAASSSAQVEGSQASASGLPDFGEGLEGYPTPTPPTSPLAASHRPGGGRHVPRGVPGHFRATGKRFALTYPKCPVSRAVFDPAFQLKFRPTELVTAREKHKDGTYHLHVFVSFLKRKDVRSSRYFDVAFDGITYHPNTQLCRDRSKWLKYLSKGDDHGVGDLADDGLELDPLTAPLGKRKSYHADLMWSEQQRIIRGLKPVSYPIRLECADKSYEMLAPDPSVKKRSWWIVAPPNAGKTRWINKTFANTSIYVPRMGKYPFEGYGNQDIIIYDDRKGVSFEEFSDVLNTWMFLHPVFGEVRFVTQNWRMGHSRNVIVLSNKTIEESMPEEDWVRMKKRFIQIVNPVLLPPEEMSDDEVEEKAPQAPEWNSADFQS